MVGGGGWASTQSCHSTDLFPDFCEGCSLPKVADMKTGPHRQCDFSMSDGAVCVMRGPPIAHLPRSLFSLYTCTHP